MRNLPSFLRYPTAGWWLERLGALGGMATFTKAMSGGFLAEAPGP